jgi:hypothetical protein
MTLSFETRNAFIPLANAAAVAALLVMLSPVPTFIRISLFALSEFMFPIALNVLSQTSVSLDPDRGITCTGTKSLANSDFILSVSPFHFFGDRRMIFSVGNSFIHKVDGAPRLRAITGGPADPSVIATQAEAKTGGGMGDGAVELAARRLKEGDLSALTNIGRGAQASHDLGRIQNRMADILVKEDGLSLADAAKKVSASVQAFKASQTGQSAEARTGATREANLNLILKATDAAIPAALEASDKVNRTGWVPLNKIIQKGQIATSDPDLMKLGMANLQLAEHWARAMNPTGVMRESDREKALEFLSTATSKETYKALVEQLRTQITRERDAVKGVAPGSTSPYSPSGAAPATPGAAPGAGGVTHFSDYFK